MGKLQPARGTRDIFGEEARRMRFVAETFLSAGQRYGFEELTPPIFEFLEVFKRPLGEGSDIVSKEMYVFRDRGDEELTLRPEFTAGICRAFISNGLQQKLPARLMAYGPAFRYERPQKGRYRQFHQINAELIGAADPETDVDVLAFAWRVLTDLGIAGDVTLHLNSLGDRASRAAYRDALVTYFSGYKDALSEDSQRRLATNPLRILDSKSEGDRDIAADAPRLSAFYTPEAADFFDRVRRGLDVVGIPYLHDERLVRGLDYYTHTCFEFITSALGAQGTVIGGGRYDGLVAQLGGPDVAGIGFAGGIERLAMLLDKDPGTPSPAVIIPLDAASGDASVRLAEALRDAGLIALIERSGKIGKRLQRADNAGAQFALIIGEDEVARGEAQIKDLQAGTQETVALDKVPAYLVSQSSKREEAAS